MGQKRKQDAIIKYKCINTARQKLWDTAKAVVGGKINRAKHLH